MKKLIVYHRCITERTGFRKYPFKDSHQFVIRYGGLQLESPGAPDVEDKQIRVKYRIILETRSKKELEHFLEFPDLFTVGSKRSKAYKEMLAMVKSILFWGQKA